MAFPAGNGTFALLAMIAAVGPLRRVLVAEEPFSRFHASVPAIVPWLQAGPRVAAIGGQTTGPAAALLAVGSAAILVLAAAGRLHLRITLTSRTGLGIRYRSLS